MNALKNTLLLAGLLLIQACHNKGELALDPSTNQVAFSASISGQIATRALNDEQGEEVALPYINGIYIRKVDGETAEYQVQSGHKGTLANTDNTPIQWDADLNKSVEFYAWTTPTGVALSEVGVGSVDFNVGNTSDIVNDANKVNDAFVTPLEVFVATPVVTSTRGASPSVSLPFKHLVSKLSIRVRDWAGNVQNDAVSITFLGIKKSWSVGKGENGVQIKQESATATDVLTLVGNKLEGDEKTGGFKRIYLPPLTKALGTDFKTAGDFCVEYGGKSYFGTLDYVGQKITELQAGEHLHVTMDLSENFGVGVGTKIVEWKTGAEDIIEGNAYNGIYTYDDLKRVATAVNAGDAIPPLLIDNGTIRLYRNIQIGADWEPINSATPLIFDGNGYTISGSKIPLFGLVDGATIKNLTLSDCTVTGASLLVADAANTTIENCRVIGLSALTNTGGSAGALVGTAGADVVITNCSVETSGTIAGATAGALVGTASGSGVTITNCFVVLADGDLMGLVGSGTPTISYSYFWNTFNGSTSGIFWGNATTGSTVEIAGNSSSLLEALQAGGKGWVYVYGKGYPVLRVQ